MRQLIYTLQFRGQVAPVADNSHVLKATAIAPSSTMTSTIGAGDLSCSINEIAGGKAEFDSRISFAEDGSFQEEGLIRFGEGNSFRFTTVGSGYLGGTPEENLKHGVVCWIVEGGEGQFAGASGLITSNFTVSGAGEMTDSQCGVIWVK